MDDLTITKACARAMGYKWSPKGIRKPSPKNRGWTTYYFVFDPLHNDEQAFALVKRLLLTIGCTSLKPTIWTVTAMRGNDDIESPDLNRAICEVCAKLTGGG